MLDDMKEKVKKSFDAFSRKVTALEKPALATSALSVGTFFGAESIAKILTHFNKPFNQNHVNLVKDCCLGLLAIACVVLFATRGFGKEKPQMVVISDKVLSSKEVGRAIQVSVRGALEGEINDEGGAIGTRVSDAVCKVVSGLARSS